MSDNKSNICHNCKTVTTCLEMGCGQGISAAPAVVSSETVSTAQETVSEEAIEQAAQELGLIGTIGDHPSYEHKLIQLVQRFAASTAQPDSAREAKIDAALSVISQDYFGASAMMASRREYVENAVIQLIDAGYSLTAPQDAKERDEKRTRSTIRAECHECNDCLHVGINDSHPTDAACNTCDWSGPSPKEDRCPGCDRVGTMTSACPKCSSRYHLLAEAALTTAQPADSKQDAQERDRLLTALADIRDMFPVPERGSELEQIWSGAIGCPEEVPCYVKACLAALAPAQLADKPWQFMAEDDAYARLTEMKTKAFIDRDGYRVSGYILNKGNKICLSYGQAIRCMDAEELFEVMHCIKDAEKVAAWKYCPECGCTDWKQTGYGEGRFCDQCGQEWFPDIDYTNVMARNLAKKTQQHVTLIGEGNTPYDEGPFTIANPPAQPQPSDTLRRAIVQAIHATPEAHRVSSDILIHNVWTAVNAVTRGAQPQQLTDADIQHIWDGHVGPVCEKYPLKQADILHFARAIESALLSSHKAVDKEGGAT